MDKIQEALIKHNNKGEFAFSNDIEITEREWDGALDSYFKAGFEAADLLPTEKVCPECGGSGTIFKKFDSINAEILCPICKGSSTISLYYTPEQYEKIMGKPYPDDVLVWCYTPVYIDPDEEENGPYETVNYYYWKPIVRKENSYQNKGVIVQTAQPAPDADYRPEE